MSRVSLSKNKEISTMSFDDLPHNLTVEILLRLPVKTLIRSTSVNKTWYCLINDPTFISSQIRKVVSSCDRNALLIIPAITSHRNYCSLISADTSSLIEKFDIPFKTKSRSLKLLAQVHGLLLLTDSHIDYASRELYLWNPYVKRHRLLVSSCFKKLLDNTRDKSFYVAGMGFHKATNDYRIVRIFYVQDDKGEQFGEVAPKVEIFSLRKNTWRKIKDPGVTRLAREDGAYVNGVYYWCDFKQPGTVDERTYYGNKLRILFFDFDNEVFGELKVPDDLPENSGYSTPLKLMEFEGSLALFCVLDAHLYHHKAGTSSYPYSIWLMRQENGVVSWTLRFKSVLEKHGLPLGVTKNGTLVLEAFRPRRCHITSIVSCNLRSMIYKDHGFGKHGIAEDLGRLLAASTVDTCFPQSMIMYEGGKSLLKFAN